jgi:hypothetical protein
MTAPNTSNQVTDDQPTPGKFGLTQITSGLTNLIVHSHDVENGIHEFVAKMHGDGSWSTHTKDANGSITDINHGAYKLSSQAQHEDVMGNDQKRVGGGSVEAIQNGRDEQVGESKTLSVDGPSLDNLADSKKVMSKGGDGHQFMKGDQTFTVDEGGVHYEVSKDFSITSKGQAISFNTDNEFSVVAKGNEGHTVSQNFTVNAAVSITLSCGTSQIIMTPSKITIKASEIEFIKV